MKICIVYNLITCGLNMHLTLYILQYSTLHTLLENYLNFRDITWNVEENQILHELFCVVCIMFSPLHFMLYRGKSITFGTVYFVFFFQALSQKIWKNMILCISVCHGRSSRTCALCMFYFCTGDVCIQARHILLHLLQPWQAWFLCWDSNYF